MPTRDLANGRHEHRVVRVRDPAGVPPLHLDYLGAARLQELKERAGPCRGGDGLSERDVQAFGCLACADGRVAVSTPRRRAQPIHFCLLLHRAPVADIAGKLAVLAQQLPFCGQVYLFPICELVVESTESHGRQEDKPLSLRFSNHETPLVTVAGLDKNLSNSEYCYRLLTYELVLSALSAPLQGSGD